MQEGLVLAPLFVVGERRPLPVDLLLLCSVLSRQSACGPDHQVTDAPFSLAVGAG